MSKQLNPGEIRLDWLPSDWGYTPLGSHKQPYISRWHEKPFTVEEISDEITAGNCKAIGVISGSISNDPKGLVWVDCDGSSVVGLIADLAKMPLEEALPPTLTIMSGREGRFRKLYAVKKDDFKYFVRNKYIWHSEVEHEQLEILWARHQGAIMGAHPETAGYFTPEGLGFEWTKDLPQIPGWLLQAIITKNSKCGKPAKEYSRFVGPGFAIQTEISLERDIKLATEAMWALPIAAVDDYDIWLTIGQSLHSLDESLLDHWDQWSAQSDKYKAGECRKRWRSFNKDGGRGIGSLIHIAQENGFKPSQDYRAMPVDNDTLDSVSVLLKQIEEDLPMLNHMESLVKTSNPSVMLEEASLDQFLEQYEAVQKQKDNRKKSDQKGNKQRNMAANEVTDLLIQIFGGSTLFNQIQGQFFVYEKVHKGLWSPVTKLEMLNTIRGILSGFREQLPHGFSANFMNDVFMQLQAALTFNGWHEDNNHLLFANGVLKIDERLFLPFNKKMYLTQRMPYCYDPAADCEPIIKWLKFTQREDWGRVQVLRAWLRATLLSCYDIQKFLEIIGPGKSGKSTYANLAVALVGKNNTYSTDFNNLETNRFETIGFMDKKLLLFQDMDRWGGSVSKLKAVTGGDWIRVERKFQAENLEPFQYQGMVMITANEAIQTTDYTSGLARRRLTVPFDRPFEGSHSEQRELIKFDSEGTPKGEFAALLPGLVNWLLDLSTEDMRAYLMSTSQQVKFFKDYEKIQSLRSNTLLDWMEHILVFAPGEQCSIGFAKHAPPGGSGTYVNWDRWLYASYCEFCKLSNVNIMSRNRFEFLFFDVCKNQLKMNVYHVRNARGMLVFNVAIRESNPGFKGYPSIVEVSSDKEKFKEFYGVLIDEDQQEKDQWPPVDTSF